VGLWTSKMVLAAKVHAFLVHPPLEVRGGHVSPVFDETKDDAKVAALLIAVCIEVFGHQSIECRALLTWASARARGEPSLREICRVGIGWRRGRASLYRLRDRAARLMAAELNRRAVPAPQPAQCRLRVRPLAA